jgi:cohesin loading factor subunit SCC2
VNRRNLVVSSRRTYFGMAGFLFRAYPTLMTLESSATIMDAIFTTPDEEARGRLLKIMQDFLITESTKQSAQEKGQSIVEAEYFRLNIV